MDSIDFLISADVYGVSHKELFASGHFCPIWALCILDIIGNVMNG